ncbi:hypothetical protein D3C85_1791030 [compost metagenome]
MSGTVLAIMSLINLREAILTLASGVCETKPHLLSWAIENPAKKGTPLELINACWPLSPFISL